MVFDFNSTTSTQLTEKKPETLRKSRKNAQPDPFAGMNSSVNYEKEIEKLKQQIVKKKSPMLSRSTSPDSSDAESISSDYVSEAEKARFLAFVRSWTGHWKGGWSEGNLEASGSLWSDQSPWNMTIGKKPSDPLSNQYDLYSPWKH